MGLGSALRELAGYVEACESGERRVTGVCFAECVDPESDGTVTADVDVALPTPDSSDDTGGASLSPAGVDADGRLHLSLESGGPVVPTTDHDVTVDPAAVSVTPGGSLAVTLSVSTPIDGATPETRRAAAVSGGTEVGATERLPAGADHPSTGDGTAATRVDDADPGGRAGGENGRDRDLPPFRDRELLAEVYESCGTFAEMADRLEMDVTAETVRRYMIDYDIHQPASYDTGGDATEGDDPADGSGANATDDPDTGGTDGHGEVDAGGPEPATEPAEPATVVLSDGIGLPDDVTVEQLVETVKRSNTIYEVTKDIDVDIDRQDALDMLQELNLLDLVVGRLATESDRDISREEVIERLRDASATA